jgi:hypothetical protein
VLSQVGTISGVVTNLFPAPEGRAFDCENVVQLGLGKAFKYSGEEVGDPKGFLYAGE